MAVQVGSRYGGRGAKAEEAAKKKERRQKTILIAGAVLLVLVLAIQGPKTLKSLSGNSTPASPSPAMPISSQSSPGAAAATADRGDLPRRVSHFPAKDPFVAQVASAATPGVTASAPPSDKVSMGPRVSPTHFATKDPFVLQIAPAASATAVAATVTAAPTTEQTVSKSVGMSGPGYIVVLAKPSTAHGPKPAIRAVVAAQNAGLIDIKVMSSQKSSATNVIVYAGPYATHTEAEKELVRALRVGYVTAYLTQVQGGF